jgi:hypothetical protein
LLEFRADAYLSLCTGDLPILQNDELQITLPSTFALYNAYGLDIFYRRYPTEPLDRSLYKICDLATMISQRTLPSVVLFEDLQHGLLAATKDIAILSQSRRSRNPMLQGSNPQSEYLANQLEIFKLQLDRVVSVLTSKGFQTQAGESLLAAYSGREEPGQHAWKDSVMARIWSHVFLTATLYHMLSIHLYTDVDMVKQFVIEQVTTASEATGVSPRQQRRASQVEEWALSQDGRNAVLHAISALRVGEQALALCSSREGTIDPMILTSVSVAASVVWAWSTSEHVPFGSAHGMPSLEIGFGALSVKRPDVDRWVHNGGPANLQGVLLCKANERVWLSRFTAALSRGAQLWHLGNPVVTALMSRAAKPPH